MSKFTFIMHLKSTNIEISLKGPIWKGQSKSQKVISTKRFGQKLRNSSFRETKIWEQKWMAGFQHIWGKSRDFLVDEKWSCKTVSFSKAWQWDTKTKRNMNTGQENNPHGPSNLPVPLDSVQLTQPPQASVRASVRPSPRGEQQERRQGCKASDNTWHAVNHRNAGPANDYHFLLHLRV